MLDVQLVVFVRLVCDLQLVHHHHEDDAARVRLRSALLPKAVESRRDVKFDRRQRLRGDETRIHV